MAGLKPVASFLAMFIYWVAGRSTFQMEYQHIELTFRFSLSKKYYWSESMVYLIQLELADTRYWIEDSL